MVIKNKLLNLNKILIRFFFKYLLKLDKMNTQNIQADKLSLITWITQLQDVSLIRKLKNIQTDNVEIPQWQIEEVNKRLKDLDKNPGNAIDFDKTLDRLEEKYGL